MGHLVYFVGGPDCSRSELIAKIVGMEIKRISLEGPRKVGSHPLDSVPWSEDIYRLYPMSVSTKTGSGPKVWLAVYRYRR